MYPGFSEKTAIPAVEFTGFRWPDSNQKDGPFSRRHRLDVSILNLFVRLQMQQYTKLFLVHDPQPNIFERIANRLVAGEGELAVANNPFSAMLFRVLLPLLTAFWLTACHPRTEAGYQPAQTANLALTRTFHRLLKQHNWLGADSLFAPTVHYRGRLLGESEVEVPRAQCLSRFRQMLRTARSDTLVVRQIYPAGAYHVIVEGVTTGPADTARSVCLIYTIEHQRITRVCVY